MGRKFRLSTHRKNEERKLKRAEQAEVVPVGSLVVSLPLEHLWAAEVTTSLSTLQSRLQASCILPRGT